MKRWIKVTASENVYDDISFSVTQILELLSQIAELRGKDISAEPAPSGDLRFLIGDSAYEIMGSGEDIAWG